VPARRQEWEALSSAIVRSVRRCSRTGCTNPAVATLTYAYADSTAVVGPLATYSEPHSYDLCEEHAMRLTVPRGWEVVRHEGEFAAPEPSVDDLTALAEAVREAGRADRPVDRVEPTRMDPSLGAQRRGHLRVLPDPIED
jgi:Protein of unknown function (DUF3499)